MPVCPPSAELPLPRAVVQPTPTAPPHLPVKLPDIAFSTIVTDYLNFIQHAEGKARRTVDTYKDWLTHYRKWCDAQELSPGFYERFNTPVLQRFRYYLSIRGLRPRTVRTIFGPLRQMGEYCIKNNLLEHNHAKDITLPQKDASGRKQVTQDELKQLLAAVERQRDKKKVALHRAMLSVLVYCGPRFQEWLDLKVEHVNFESKSVLIACGKGSKSRTLYPVPECMTALDEYMRVRPTNAVHNWLWVFDVRRRMGEMGARQMIDDMKAIAGLETHDNIQPHAVRHAFATRCMERGMNIKAIQACLGHESISTTWEYLHCGEEAAKAMADYGGFENPLATPALSQSSASAASPVPPKGIPESKREGASGRRKRFQRVRQASPRHG